MKILLFGHNGQVAQEIRHRKGEVEIVSRSRSEADFSKPETCLKHLSDPSLNAVINAVAYTAVDKAEEEEDLATQINATTPGLIASACAARNLPLVHISTDYVFSGEGNTAFQPEDPTSPPNAYGRSKLAGERAVRAASGPHAILRTSWVFSSHGQNFVKTMLRLGAERDQLSIVSDQIGGPTPASAIADTCLEIAKQLQDAPQKSGTYHLSGQDDTSWSGFAREIFTQADLACAVQDIPTSAYPTPAKRPLNSRLDNNTLKSAFGLSRPEWKLALREVLSELGHAKR